MPTYTTAKLKSPRCSIDLLIFKGSWVGGRLKISKLANGGLVKNIGLNPPNLTRAQSYLMCGIL